MTIAAIIIFIIAILLLISGGIWSAVSWLIWVAIALAVVAIIVFLLRFITGRTRA